MQTPFKAELCLQNAPGITDTVINSRGHTPAGLSNLHQNGHDRLLLTGVVPFTRTVKLTMSPLGRSGGVRNTAIEEEVILYKNPQYLSPISIDGGVMW